MSSDPVAIYRGSPSSDPVASYLDSSGYKASNPAVPRHSHHPMFDYKLYARMEEGGLVHFIM